MSTGTYYNENNAAACSVLRRQIAFGALPDGLVDDRSIEQVAVSDVQNYREAHFFAGIGGFALGFAQANMGNAVNVWTGGFPCQDLSVAGNRAGLAGSRSGLYFQFHRLIAGVRPDWVVLENVPGLLSSNSGKDFAIVLAGFTGVLCRVPDGGWQNAGFAKGRRGLYNVTWRILDAQHFGVAQRRRRVFIVGHLGSGRAAQVLFEQQGGERHPESRQQAGQGTAATVSASPPSRRNGGSDPTAGHFIINRMRGFGDYAEDDKAGILKARDGKDATDLIVGTLSVSGSGTARTGNERTEADMLVVAEAIDVRNSRSNGGISGTLQSKANGGYSLNYQNPIAFNWNAGAKQGLADGAIAGTIRSGHLNMPAVQSTQMGVRRLTPLECERLQGFPDGWTEGLSDSARYQRLGNAVAVPVIEWLGRRIMALNTHDAHAAGEETP